MPCRFRGGRVLDQPNHRDGKEKMISEIALMADLSSSFTRGMAITSLVMLLVWSRKTDKRFEKLEEELRLLRSNHNAPPPVPLSPNSPSDISEKYRKQGYLINDRPKQGR